MGEAIAAGEDHADGNGDDGDSGAEDGNEDEKEDERPTPAAIDPIFGMPSAGPSPCLGDEDGHDGDGHDAIDSTPDCLDEFSEPIRPSHEIDVRIDLPPLLIAVAQAGVLSPGLVKNINDAAADGEIADDNLPNVDVTVPGVGDNVPLTDIAGALASMDGFHYHPTGIHVQPGDVVVWDAETPDHGVAAFHERHGRQNRVPDGVGPIAAPLIPAEGYWLYRFEKPGVYDLYCPPHQLFGMVMRVVVHEGEGDVPTVEESVDPIESPELRPPEHINALSTILGGLDPNLPSEADAFETDALDPTNVVENGIVGWEEVVDEHRG
jgi:plastocyanin